MTTFLRIALTCTLASGALAGSAILGGCSNDVPTPPWYPNYEDSGYGPKGGAGGLGGGTGNAGGSGAGGSAGDAGDPAGGGSAGDAGNGP
ncbi:MAG TPA: hypothetical protein VER11_04515 [Polyangiaceae bacterium]|nr:hypothetical protein [Polyangiaceae bacterium]